MADYPDIYADGYAMAVGPFGVTITLQRSDPPLIQGVSDTNEIVARIRFSLPLAKALAQAINDALAAQLNVQPGSKAKN